MRREHDIRENYQTKLHLQLTDTVYPGNKRWEKSGNACNLTRQLTHFRAKK